LLTFLLIAISLNSFSQDVVSIQKGSPAPFTGILFTETKATEIRSELLELDKTKVKLEARDEQLKLHKSIIDLKSTEIELYRKQNERLERTNRTSDTMNYIYFGLGVFLTGAAVYGAGSLSK
jgi:hypothetical protein